MSDFTLYMGDCRDILPALEGIDAIVSDPPYGMNNDNDYTRFTKGPNGHGKTSLRKYAPIVGDDKQFDPSHLIGYRRVLLWGFNHFANALPKGTTLVWIKRHDHAFGSFLSDAELAWMNTGQGVYCKRDLSMNGETLNRLHPTQKPVPLMKWAIQRMKLSEGSTICDPYMGSGTTGVAALQLGYNFIGIEIDPEYYAIAEKRIAAAQAQLPMILQTGAEPNKVLQPTADHADHDQESHQPGLL